MCVLCFCFCFCFCFVFVFVFVLCVLMMLVELVSFFGGVILLNLDVITTYFQIQHCIFVDEGGWWLIFCEG